MVRTERIGDVLHVTFDRPEKLNALRRVDIDEVTALLDDRDLRAAGVPVEFREFRGAYHGFDAIVPKAAISVAARAFRDQWFGYAVRTYFAPQP